MKIKNTILLLVIILTVVLLISGCTKQTNADAQHEAKKIVKVGVSMPLTGAVADSGSRFIEGANIALSENPSENYEIQFVVEDDKCSATDASLVANKLLNKDGLDKIIVYCSAASPPFITGMQNGNGIIFVESIKLEIDEGKNPFVFNMLPSAQKEIDLLANEIIKTDKNVAIIYQQDYFGETYKNKFTKTFESLGGKVVFVEGFDKNANKDFRSSILKFQQADINVVVNFMSHPANYDILLKQAEEMNFHPKYYSQWLVENPTLLNLTGSLSNGIIYTHPYVVQDSAVYQKISSAYQAKYGRGMNLDAINGYDTALLMLQLAEKCGSDSECMKASLNNGDKYTGLLGDIVFNKNMKDVPVYLKMISEGEFVKLERS